MSDPITQMFVDEQFVADTLGNDILEAAKRDDPRAVFKLLLARHSDVLMNTDPGALFAGALARRVRREDFRDRLAREFSIYTAGRLPAPDGPRKGG